MEISKFFNSAPGDPRKHQASDFASYFGNVLRTGLLHTNNVPALEVRCEGTDLRTYVTPGKAIMEGYAYENTNNLYLQHELPEATLDRIDRIVLRLDKRNQSRFIRLFVIQGEASATPVAPTLQRDEFIYELSLAQIRVRANTASLVPADLIDERLNEDLCGLVSSLISIPTSQFQEQWDTWFQKTGEYEQQWEEWFNTQQLEGFVTQVEFEDELRNVNVQESTLVQGANTITSVQKTPLNVLSAKGRTLINLLGRTSEPSTLVTARGATTKEIDRTLKITISTGNTDSVYYRALDLKAGKHYILLGDLKNGNAATGVRLRLGSMIGPNITSTTSSKVYLVSSPVSDEIGSTVGFQVIGTAGQYGYVYGLRIYEISQFEKDELATMTADQVAQKYPYVDSIQGIVNPTIKVGSTQETIQTTLHSLNGVYDEITREDGVLKKIERVREVSLDGRLPWAFYMDYGTYKSVNVVLDFIANTNDNTVAVKYDGKILPRTGGVGLGADLHATNSGSKLIYINIADVDSGWGESYTPTADEIKAYFYGWKMYDESTNPNGTGTFNGTGTKRWCYHRSTDNTFTGGTPNLPTGFAPGDSIRQPYKLVYQVVSPQTYEVPTVGQVLLEEGPNTVELKQGVVIRERANPYTEEAWTAYVINNSTKPGSLLSNKTTKVLSVYENGTPFTKFHTNSLNGLMEVAILKPDFNPHATYHVDYEIFPELTVKVESINVEYNQNIKSVVDGHTGQLKAHEEKLDLAIFKFNFAEKIATSGFQKLPSGFILQWGKVTSWSGGDLWINFPIAMPTGVLSIQTTPIQGGTPTSINSVSSFTKAGFNMRSNVNSLEVFWVALGY